MPSFQDALTTMLKHEGGYVNHPNDRGGPTNFGVTQKVYSTFLKRPATIDDMKNMPISHARQIYKKNYWDPVMGDNIKYYTHALYLFDQAVNRGVSGAVKQVQRALNLPVDGRMTASTLNTMNNSPEKATMDKFLAESEAAYKRIVELNPSQSVFIKGWLNRVSSLRTYSAKYLGQLNKPVVGVALLAALGALSLFLYMQTQKKTKGKLT